VQLNSPRRLAWWLAALFLTAAAAKLWLIQACGTPTPYFDQWVEADRFLKPWVEGHLTWHDWLAPHNGHRIFFTRLLDLLSIKLNGEWDLLLQMTLNAFLHAGVGCGLVGCLWHFSGRQDQGLLCLLLVPFLALPVAAENTLWSFQSQFYFLLLFGIAALAGLGFHRPGSPGWLLGLGAASLGLFTMASGFLAPLAVAGLLGLRSWQTRRLSRASVITAIACLGVAAIGAALGNPAGVAGPHSWGGFLSTLAWTLVWPFENQPTLLLFTSLPLTLLTVKYLKGHFPDPRAAEFVLALALWGALQSAALAYARTSQVNCSRYADLFCLLPIASLASLFLLGGAWLPGVSRARQTALATGWAVILLGGLWHLSPRDWQNLDAPDNYPLWSAQIRLVQQENIRIFLATGNPDCLRHYPDFATITNLLPRLARILPPECRAPLPLEPDAGTDAAFVAGGCAAGRPPREFTRAWGNAATNGTITTGRFVSRPLTARLPRLQLELCCVPNAENIRIELVEPATGRHFPVRPQSLGQWQLVTMPAPENPFRLEITAHNPAAWVAVGALQESGRLSAAARGLLAHAVPLLLAGLGLFAGLLARDLWCRTGGVSAPVRGLALGTVLAVLVLIWPARHFDSRQLASQYYAHWAQSFAQTRQLDAARRFLREALWLCPADQDFQARQRALPPGTRPISDP